MAATTGFDDLNAFPCAPHEGAEGAANYGMTLRDCLRRRPWSPYFRYGVAVWRWSVWRQMHTPWLTR